MEFFYLVLPLCYLIFAFLSHSVACEVTRINFPYFTAEDNMKAFGDAGHNIANRSFVTNADARMQSSGTCGELMYGNKVRIQDVDRGRAASFSTSFSFAFTTHGLFLNDTTADGSEGSGLAFMFIRSAYFAAMKDFLAKWGWAGGCKSRSDPNLSYNPSSFNLIISTDNNPKLKAPSNNYLRIGKNIDYEHKDPEPYCTHNLCGNDTHCSYFSNGRVFTAWIDFSSSAQILEVRLANGSSPSVKKPVKPLLHIPNFEIPKGLGDDVYLTFWGSSDVNHVETHELLSWSFFSSGVSESSIPSPRTLLRFLKAGTWASVTVGVLGMVAAVVILWYISRFVRSSRYHRYTKLKYGAGHHVFSYAELRKATQNFDERNLLGTGGSGSVYRGSLEGPSGGIFVAVKQIHISESKQAEALFHAEVSSLGQIRHRNVVQLHGWCQEKGRLLLVYDYMPNGGLNEWLHKCGDHRQVLSLKTRHSILEGVGAALEYLHEDCQSCILHRDIKSSNVLLDADFNARLGDFGHTRSTDHHKMDKTTLAAGTLGYMAPEISYTGKATKESDVYSFGILVLEVVCGRRPLDVQAVEPEDLVLLYVVWRAHQAGSLLSVADPRLLQTLHDPSSSIVLGDDESTYAMESLSLPSDSHNSTENNISISTIVDMDVEVHKMMVVNLLHLALLCCLPNPKARPSMGQVNGILQQIRSIENASAITLVSMPSLPATKPLGLYPSLEFSQSAVNSTACAPSTISLSFSKSSPDNSTSHQGGGSLHKDD